MSNKQVTRTRPLPVPADPLVLAYAEQAHSAATRRAYRADWARWERWSARRGATPLPADPIVLRRYVHEAACDHALTTIVRWLSSISVAHHVAGYCQGVGPGHNPCFSPTRDQGLRTILKGMARHPQHAGNGRRTALRLADLRAVCAALPNDPEGVRDRAILTLGWAGALRRSEIAALEVRDLSDDPEGIAVRIRRSKTDQEGRGERVGIPRSHPGDPACPVTAVLEWLDASMLEEGPLFRSLAGGLLGGPMSGWMIWRVATRRLGHLEGSWGGHSLRAGLATEAALANVPVLTIQRQTRHKNLNQLLAYVRAEGDLWSSNAAAMAGLR